MSKTNPLKQIVAKQKKEKRSGSIPAAVPMNMSLRRF